jgi:carbamoyltransferase
MAVPKLLSEYAEVDLTDKVVWVPHHISHAGSAYYVSPFEESAVLSIDGIGEITTTWLGVGNGNKISVIKEIAYPNSIGFLWEKFSKFLGFSEYDAAKVMGLASYGNKKKFHSLFKKLVLIEPEGNFRVDDEILRFRSDDYEPLEKLFNVKKLDSPQDRTTAHEDIAAGLQAITNDVVLNLGKFLFETTKSKNLCLSGGVALNCISNFEIMKGGYFKNIYIQPAAHDAGTALGAAYYIWNDLQSQNREFVMEHAFWGPDYTENEIESVLISESVKYQKLENIEEITAKLISEGKIIGWFQEKMEWGPRALGHRSLLVDPRNINMKEILNMRIKKREPFRPFAPSVLSEDADNWFDIPTNCVSISTEFMEFAFPVKEDKKKSIPAVTHVDGTSRIQIVRKEINPKYHKLISEFKKITGVPMILNTSFNDNEPIVCSPNDAVKTFKTTDMDYLVIQDFLVSKEVEK